MPPTLPPPALPHWHPPLCPRCPLLPLPTVTPTLAHTAARDASLHTAGPAESPPTTACNLLSFEVTAYTLLCNPPDYS